MADFTPRTVFTNYASNGTSVIFPLDNFKSLSPNLADADYGDAREVIRGVVEKAYEYLSSLPEEDRPQNFSIERESPEFTGNTLKVSYTVSYTLGIRSDDLKLA
jgi:hypothetical protein